MTQDKTQEEILKESGVQMIDFISLSSYGGVLKAMQEYADQEKRKAFNEALELVKSELLKEVVRVDFCKYVTQGEIVESIDRLKIK